MRRISQDFVKNSKTVESSKGNLESLSNAVNEILTVEQEFHDTSKTVTEKVTSSLDSFLNNYDASKASYLVDIDTMYRCIL